MPLFTLNNRLAGTQQALSTSFKTIIAITAATAALRRGKITQIGFGADGAPNATDCQVVYDVSRQTAAGTSTPGTPNPKDAADGVAGSVGALNFTGEGTITATSSLWAKALNQRASQIWYAKDDEDALIWPATNLAGLAIRALSPTYASLALVDAVFRE